MQTPDGVTDQVSPPYPDPGPAADTPKIYSPITRLLAVAVGWLVPGAGHLALGKFGRAALFFVVIVGAFALGLALHGRPFWPTRPETPGLLPYDMISVLYCFAQVGAGLCYVISYALGLGLPAQSQAATYEYGNTFMCLAGLLNYLVTHDAFDIAAGRKH